MLTENSLTANPPVEFDSAMEKFSKFSTDESSVICTVINFGFMSPSCQVSVPLTAVKSPGAIAVPATVL